MREATRQEEHPMIVLRELDGNVLPEGRRADAHVHSYIKYPSTDDTHELSLCVRG